MRFLRTICVLAIMLIASLPTGLATCEPLLIEGPRREANEPIELGSCAYVNQLANSSECEGIVSLRFGSFESRSPFENDLRWTRAKGIPIASRAAELNLCRA